MNRIASCTKFGALVLAAGTVLSTATAAEAENTKAAAYRGGLTPTHKNLAYAKVSPNEKLDLFLPHGKGPFPVVVNIHGGAFEFGTKEDLDPACAKAFLDNGYAVASIDYRLSGEAKFPAAVQDAKAAIRFLRANAGELRLNPDKMAVFGQSAGGNIAAIVGTSSGVAELEGQELGNPAYTGSVEAVIDWFGPTNFLLMDEQAIAQGCPAEKQTRSKDGPEGRWLGAPLSTVPELVKRADPTNYIDASDPPQLIEHGDADCVVPYQQSVLLYDALKKAGVPAELVKMPGAGHGDQPSSPPVFSGQPNIQKMLDFLKTSLQ